MLTNPNTCGLFEFEVVEIAKAVHDAGAYFYCDGANFNAIVGKVRPGDLGIDAMHINLHKTFSTPHGGGGPGSGPVVLSAALAPFAPLPFLTYVTNTGPAPSHLELVETMEHPLRGPRSDYKPFGRLTAFHGQMGMFVRALTYMLSHGADGMRQASEDAVLNANYIRVGLRDVMSQPFGDKPCMHEALFDDAWLKDTGVTTLDFAKAMIDEGYHPMTMYFPLVVHGAMLIEPTESESKDFSTGSSHRCAVLRAQPSPAISNASSKRRASPPAAAWTRPRPLANRACAGGRRIDRRRPRSNLPPASLLYDARPLRRCAADVLPPMLMKKQGEDEMKRRTFLIGSVASAALTAKPANAQVGAAPVKIVFPFGAGGGGDAVSRLMAERLASALGRPVIVENKTGADGRIGIQSVKSAPPDGDTLLITTGPTMWLYPMTHPAPGYDPLTDFAAVAQLARFEFCIAVANNTGLKTMAELAAWIKANPDKAAYGVPGAGTIPHFTGVGLGKLLGTEMRRVPYRGGAPAMTDLVAGQIPIVVGTLADALQQHRAGTIRIVAVASKTRSPFVPDVPTLIESGFNLSGEAWYGLWAPAKTPPATVEKIKMAIVAALADDTVKKRLDILGLIPSPTDQAGLTAVMKSDAAFWADIVKASGFRME